MKFTIKFSEGYKHSFEGTGTLEVEAAIEDLLTLAKEALKSKAEADARLRDALAKAENAGHAGEVPLKN
jgi:hypothetical protein